MSHRRDRGRFNNRHKYGNKFNGPRKFEGTSNNFHNKQDKMDRFMAQQRFSENEVGITEYLSDLPSFSGVIKARFSDFHVNEINTAGEIAKLTDMSAPDFEESADVDVDEVIKSLGDLISKETWDKLNEIVTSSEEISVELDVSNFSKEDRGKIHESVKEVFGNKIQADTKIVDEKKFITFKKYSKDSTSRKNSHFKWPKNKGEYVYFLVYKEVTDTLEATFRISDSMRMRSSNFTYAGVKDRRAKTTQWFCVRKVNPQMLITKTKYCKKIHIGNISFKDEPLKLGQLSGNRFRIALRNVTGDDDLINNSITSLKENGFINYYGLQRFGNDKEVPTYEIGIKLLQGKWKEACNLILKPKLADDPNSDITKAKQMYRDTSNCKLAADEFNRNYNKCVESKLLLGLAKTHDNDYVNALENIPRNMRLLYIHAFQSLIWNKMTSRRIKEFGYKPIVGDIILSERIHEIVEEVPPTEEENTEEAEEDKYDVKILTEEDLPNYSIYDVVLPLAGYDIKYPENDVKSWYEEALKEYGLSLEMSKQKVKTYTLSGAYRKIVERVNNLSWKTMRYDHPNDTLIRSDYEELRGDPEPKDNPQGQYKAVILDFCIASSCYATMALREILKMDTSSLAHAKLNKYHDSVVDAGEEERKDTKPKQFAESDSLLSDSTKYEEFKQMIFGAGSEETEKRKITETDEDAPVSKKMKEEENVESGIKIQPSLV